MSNKHMGPSIDEFLEEEGILDEAQSQAIKEVVAWQLAEAMKKRKISKARMASYSRPAAPRWTASSTQPTISRYPACNGRRLSWGAG